MCKIDFSAQLEAQGRDLLYKNKVKLHQRATPELIDQFGWLIPRTEEFWALACRHIGYQLFLHLKDQAALGRPSKPRKNKRKARRQFDLAVDDFSLHAGYYIQLDERNRDMAVLLSDQVAPIKMQVGQVVGDLVDFNKIYDTAQQVLANTKKTKPE